MDQKRNLEDLVNETLDSALGNNTVKTPAFFKERVLNRMQAQETEKESGLTIFNWFTPKYQVVALICFVVLNTVALVSYSSDNYTENVADFADSYGLSTTGTNAYLSQN